LLLSQGADIEGLSKERTSEKTLMDPERRSENLGRIATLTEEVLPTLSNPTRELSQTQRIHAAEASANAEDQGGDAFAAVGRQIAVETCSEWKHG
jgi:hypothetical protein